MARLYKCLDDGAVGVFESPTGTGKSLSLVCGALRWLLDMQNELEREVLASAAGEASDEPAWVTEQTHGADLEKAKAAGRALQDSRAKRAERLKRFVADSHRAQREARHQLGRPPASKRGSSAADSAAKPAAGEPEADFALAEWEEGAAASGGLRHRVGAQASGLHSLSDSDDEPEAAGERKPWQILYCSRTHSQLAQVVGEVRKTEYGSQLSVVSLGSRKALCTNDAVRELPGGAERVNEACLDLQSKASKAKAAKEAEAEEAAGGKAKSAKGGCPYLRGASAEEQQAVSDRIHLRPHDVEELHALGKSSGCCAYYASRGAVSDAQLILLPYASLLHAGTRAALGIELKRSVVIVDEAHNLIDTINDMHSVTLHARQLSEVSASLAQYAERYHARLKPANRMMVQQLLHVVRALRAALLPGAAPAAAAVCPPVASASGAPGATASDRIVRMNAFLCSLNIDHINLFKLQAFCAGSEIAKKLRGFVDSQAAAARPAERARELAAERAAAAGGAPFGGVAGGASGSAATLHGVLRVLDAFTNADADGRVLLHLESGAPAAAGPAASAAAHAPAPAPASGPRPDSWLRVLHLNPAVYFSKVIEEAHAVVLAGGTMQPFADLEQQVFHQLPKDSLRLHSFGHIVPPHNLLPVVLPAGPGGVPLQFTFGSRGTPALMDELGRVTLSLCSAVPDGVVMFLPSLSYEILIIITELLIIIR